MRIKENEELIVLDGCPPIAWHILEIVINALMVIEVGTRWIAYGKVSSTSARENIMLILRNIL